MPQTENSKKLKGQALLLFIRLSNQHWLIIDTAL